MPRVLLVEDTPALREILARLLHLQGFEVKEATDGQDALRSLPDFLPNLVVTDMMMPVMGGLELIEKLRANPQTANLPVVAITADSSRQIEIRARLAGANDFITKPVDLPQLVTRMNALLC